MKKLKNTIVVLLVMLLIMAAGLLGMGIHYRNLYQSQIDALTDLANAASEPKVIVQEKEKIVEKEAVITGATMQSGINDIGKLVTAEYYFTHVENHKSNLQVIGLDLPLTSSSFIFSYDGSVLAGIDFGNIKIDKDDETRIITVSLPKPEIISSAVDPDSFQLYDERNNIFNPIKVTDVANSFADLIHDEESKAIDKGLYLRAKDNAILLIENFLRATYPIRDYQIVVHGK